MDEPLIVDNGRVVSAGPAVKWKIDRRNGRSRVDGGGGKSRSDYQGGRRCHIRVPCFSSLAGELKNEHDAPGRPRCKTNLKVCFFPQNFSLSVQRPGINVLVSILVQRTGRVFFRYTHTHTHTLVSPIDLPPFSRPIERRIHNTRCFHLTF